MYRCIIITYKDKKRSSAKAIVVKNVLTDGIRLLDYLHEKTKSSEAITIKVVRE